MVEAAEKSRLTEPADEPDALSTDSGVTSASSCAFVSPASPAVAPARVTAVIAAVYPVSDRSTSVNVTGIVAVNELVSADSVSGVAAIALITGASLVPVMVIVTGWVEIALSSSLTVTS